MLPADVPLNCKLPNFRQFQPSWFSCRYPVVSAPIFPNYQRTDLSYAELLTRAAPNRTRLSDLRTEEMILNMGPQHPSTHGVLRLELITDGELVVDVIPHLGYLHRCFEKHSEHSTFHQVIPYTDRLNYVSAMMNNVAQNTLNFMRHDCRETSITVFEAI
jgi:hypothetical protein